MYCSIIDRLYHGELNPWELQPTSAEHRKTRREFEELSDRFRDSLSPKQQEKFNEAIEKYDDLCDYDIQNMFYTGFCIGSRVMMEVMLFEER